MMRARQPTVPHEPAPAKPAPAALPGVSNHAVARLATSFSPGVAGVAYEADPAGDASIARGLAAAVRRRSGEPVLQRAFLVSSTVSKKGEAECKAADLTVDAVHLTEKKRPPTAIEGSQGRHTLAWAARTRYWQARFTGMTYLKAFNELKRLARSDATVDKAMGATAADKERQALLSALDGVTETTSKATSKWIETLTWAITTYIKTSQKSSATAFPSKRPKGRNESGHLATLELANEAYRPAKGDDDLDVEPPSDIEIKAAARGLVDLHGALDKMVLWKVFNDWLEMLTVAFPNVIFDAKIIKLPTPASVNALKIEGYPAVAKLYAEMGIAGVPETVVHTTATKEKKKEDPEAEAEVSAMTGAGGSQQLAEAEPFLVRVPTSVNSGPDNAYEAKDMHVDRLVVSDERPPTKFGKDQKSHTIPWSLDRIVWIKEFSGKPLSDVIAALHQRASSEKAWSAAYSKPGVKQQRDDLLKELDDAMGAEKTIPGWTRWLDARIEEYVRTYEASAFATYATEMNESGASTAASKGEGPALRAFRRIEQQLADDATAGTVRTPDEVKARGAEVRRYGAMLIDVPKLSRNVGPVDPPTLLKRWLEDLKIVFPKVVAAHPVELEFAFADAGLVTEFHREQEQIVSSTERSVRDTTKKRREVTSTDERKKVRL